VKRGALSFLNTACNASTELAVQLIVDTATKIAPNWVLIYLFEARAWSILHGWPGVDFDQALARIGVTGRTARLEECSELADVS
jgi:hypothetical protein